MGVVHVIGVGFACRPILYLSVGLQWQEDSFVCAYWGEEAVGPSTIPSTCRVGQVPRQLGACCIGLISNRSHCATRHAAMNQVACIDQHPARY